MDWISWGEWGCSAVEFGIEGGHDWFEWGALLALDEGGAVGLVGCELEESFFVCVAEEVEALDNETT